MKLTEVFISILIFSLVSICLMETFVFISRRESGIVLSVNDTIMILKIDSMLRNEIKKIEIPYWKNYEKEASLYRDTFLLKEQKNFRVRNIDFSFDEKGKIDGFKIFWIYKEKEFKTEQKFSSVNIYRW